MVDKIVKNLKIPQAEIVKANLRKNLHVWNTYSHTVQNSLTKELKKHSIDLAFRDTNKSINWPNKNLAQQI